MSEFKVSNNEMTAQFEDRIYIAKEVPEASKCAGCAFADSCCQSCSALCTSFNRKDEKNIIWVVKEETPLTDEMKELHSLINDVLEIITERTGAKTALSAYRYPNGGDPVELLQECICEIWDTVNAGEMLRFWNTLQRGDSFRLYDNENDVWKNCRMLERESGTYAVLYTGVDIVIRAGVISKGLNERFFVYPIED